MVGKLSLPPPSDILNSKGFCFFLNLYLAGVVLQAPHLLDTMTRTNKNAYVQLLGCWI